MEEKKLILGKDRYYSLNTHETRVNNNVLVVGTSGAGKTRSIVIPNLLQATGSYIVSDPKGNLYQQYREYLEKRGYVVKKLDFTNPLDSAHYNFFRYIRNTQDIVKVAHMLICYHKEGTRNMDPFWNESGKLLMQAAISYLIESKYGENQNLHALMNLISYGGVIEDKVTGRTKLEHLMLNVGNRHPDSYAYNTYLKVRCAAERTMRSILVTVFARMGRFDTPAMNQMMAYDDIDIASIGQRKTALFVVVSDTDRSMDDLANIFFTQAMNELCRYADKWGEDSRLPVPVRFILDDFATNCTIADFPRMISSIRSREISTMLMIQAESQLTEKFGYDGRTIIGNCDTYVYLGGNDIETAKAVAERCDVPLKKILNMPIGNNWIFRRGQEPVYGENFDLEEMLERRREREEELDREEASY